jgi:hypothetical protein
MQKKLSRTIVALCDNDILGKKFEEPFENGIKQLFIREDFYKGEEKTYEEVLEIMSFWIREDATFNLAGKETIRAALEANIIKKENIQYVDDVPYALVLL